jgi:hypothetical protein
MCACECIKWWVNQRVKVLCFCQVWDKKPSFKGSVQNVCWLNPKRNVQRHELIMVHIIEIPAHWSASDYSSIYKWKCPTHALTEYYYGYKLKEVNLLHTGHRKFKYFVFLTLYCHYPKAVLNWNEKWFWAVSHDSKRKR